MNAVAIQPVTPAFAPVLAELHGACFADTGGEVWDAAAFASLLGLPGSLAWIAEDADGVPAGFLLLRVAADEAEIITIGVRPAARRRGVARALLEGGLAQAKEKGAATAFLEVADDNTRARRFYATAGFEETGRRAKYYTRAGGRVDAVVMARRL